MSIILPNGSVHEPQGEASIESMLDVLAEAQESAKARVAAAQSMTVPYAIRALLDGVDPRKVARVCGFDVSTEDDDHQAIQDWVDEYRSPFGSLLGGFGSSKPKRTGMDAFASWIGAQFTEYVRDELVS